VHFASGTAQVPLFNRAAFGAGDRVDGPAIISQLDATTLVLPNWLGEVHPSGAILLTMRTPLEAVA
jgi:N-methylhydantoinase A